MSMTETKIIRINGMEQEISEPNNTIFSDFLSQLNELLVKDQQVVASVTIDGKELTEDDEVKINNTSLANVGEIEVFTSTPKDLAYETLNTLEQYVQRLIMSIQKASQHYKGKNYIIADEYFVKSIDGLDLFVQTIGSVKIALRIGLNPKIALIEASLVSTMNDLLQAKRQSNYIFLSELLEKDLTENMKEWLEHGIPLMRNWNNN